MNKSYENLKSAVAAASQPVILLAGSRKVPTAHKEKLFRLATSLVNEFPNVLFRSGNADGSDALFARGINAVSPSRLQLVTPSLGHRKAHRHADNVVFPLGAVSPAYETVLENRTISATPENVRIIQKRNEIPQLQSKARYLLRDTLMVMGDPAQHLAPATAGIFFTGDDPMAGGTGHTIRVCKDHAVPVFLPQDWWRWLG